MSTRRAAVLVAALVTTCTLGAAADASAPPNDDVLAALGSPPASAIALATWQGEKVAIVADQDDASVHVFTLASAHEVSRTPLTGTPEQLLVTHDGRVVVALRDRNGGRVQVLAPTAAAALTLVPERAFAVAGEPKGLALTREGARLLVASGWDHRVQLIELASGRVLFTFDVAREPRSIAISTDGTRAFVTHAIGGKISLLELDRRVASTLDVSPRPGVAVATQGHAVAKAGSRLFFPVVFERPTSPGTYYGAPIVGPGVVVVDEVNGLVASSIAVPDPQLTEPVSDPRAQLGSLPSCLLPRGAAVRTHGTSVVVACLGTPFLPAFDATSDAPHHHLNAHVRVDDWPDAVAVDPTTDAIVTWSQSGRELSIVPASATVSSADDQRSTVRVVDPALSPPEVLRGRRIFHAAGDLRLAGDGRACASCHVDGRDDGVVWLTPEGRRQTPMLAGRLAGTAPYGWTRDAPSLNEYVAGTIARLRGRGLAAMDLDDVTAYLLSLRAPARAARVEDLRRGRTLFTSSELGCATCHVGAATTDGARHDVGTGSSVGERAFATPSLRFVGGTPPYLHDGRFESIRDLLLFAPGAMGRAKNLPRADVDALAAYVESL